MENPYKIDQISVFLENRAGRLAEVSRVLAEAGVDIIGLSLADTSDFGVLRMIVRQKDKALRALMQNGMTAGQTSVLAAALKNESGSLDRLLRLVSAASINVEYMYGCAFGSDGGTAMIFRFDKTDEAASLLQEHDAGLVTFAGLCAGP